MSKEIENCNCIVCAQEFNPEELQNVALSKVNITDFKICQSCFNQSNPAEDYREARDIVYSYHILSKTKHLFGEVQNILDSYKES